MGKKFTVCQGQRCPDGSSSSPSQVQTARKSSYGTIFPGHPLLSPCLFSHPCSLHPLPRVKASACAGQGNTPADCTFGLPVPWGPRPCTGVHRLPFIYTSQPSRSGRFLWLSIEAKCQVFLRNKTSYDILELISNNWAPSLLKASKEFTVLDEPPPSRQWTVCSVGIKRVVVLFPLFFSCPGDFMGCLAPPAKVLISSSSKPPGFLLCCFSKQPAILSLLHY